MKKVLIALTAGVFIPVAAMAQEIEAGVSVYDANSDHYYSFEEIHAAYPTATRAAVARADLDQNGVVVAQELAKAVAAGYFVRS